MKQILIRHASRLRHRPIDQLRQRLLIERRKRVTYLEAPIPPSNGEDLVASNQAIEMLAELNCVEWNIVSEIDYVPQRLEIDAYAYSTCENCGKAIAKKRLRALPFASLCLACKAEEELVCQEWDGSAARWETVQGTTPPENAVTKSVRRW